MRHARSPPSATPVRLAGSIRHLGAHPLLRVHRIREDVLHGRVLERALSCI
uniref:Uncharacterized protein n=1 Tax=Arundo donax TaxID=35708 RepID=A0A0A9GBB6_ARUDO